MDQIAFKDLIDEIRVEIFPRKIWITISSKEKLGSIGLEERLEMSLDLINKSNHEKLIQFNPILLVISIKAYKLNH